MSFSRKLLIYLEKKSTPSRPLPTDLIARPLADYNMPEDLIGEYGFTQVTDKALVERALQAEMIEYLGHDKHETVTNPTGNPRNGKSRKIQKVNLVNCPSRFPVTVKVISSLKSFPRCTAAICHSSPNRAALIIIAPAYDMTPMTFAPRGTTSLCVPCSNESEHRIQPPVRTVYRRT